MSLPRLAGACALIYLLLVSGAHAAALSQEQAIRVAGGIPAVQKEIDRYQSVKAGVDVQGSLYLVLFSAGDHVRAIAEIDRRSGRVGHYFTGTKAAFPLARGQGSGYATRKMNALWLWLPLTLIFVGAFFDRRRPWRLLHLDLIAIVVLGISYAFYLQGKLGASVPLVYPTLVYVLVRMLLAGLSPKRREGFVSWLPRRWLIALTLVLLGVRIGVTLTDTFVSDIGYASVAGADRIMDGLELYTRGGQHFDTYGPLSYLLYIPFVLVWPFAESQTYPPAGEAAAIAWELITVAGLVVLGRRLRPGTVLGWTLALAWVACPFTASALAVASNDGLVAALLVWAFVALQSRPLHGALAAAAAAAKIAPGYLLPVLARGTGTPTRRQIGAFSVAAVAVLVVSLAPLLPPGGLREFYDATIGFQLHRDSPFSIWSQHDALHPLQTLLKAASLGLMLALAIFPRGSRALTQVAALATAVLVAAELPLQHWFYLYVAWFLPLYCLALFTEYGADAQPAASQP